MTIPKFILRLVGLLVFYALCLLVFHAEQALGIGRTFVYSIF